MESRSRRAGVPSHGVGQAVDDAVAPLTPLGIAVIPSLSVLQNVGNSDFDTVAAFDNDIHGTVDAVTSATVPTRISAAVLCLSR